MAPGMPFYLIICVDKVALQSARKPQETSVGGSNNIAMRKSCQKGWQAHVRRHFGIVTCV